MPLGVSYTPKLLRSPWAPMANRARLWRGWSLDGWAPAFEKPPADAISPIGALKTEAFRMPRIGFCFRSSSCAKWNGSKDVASTPCNWLHKCQPKTPHETQYPLTPRNNQRPGDFPGFATPASSMWKWSSIRLFAYRAVLAPSSGGHGSQRMPSIFAAQTGFFTDISDVDCFIQSAWRNCPAKFLGLFFHTTST